jgi:hypothetical protein
MVAFNNVNRVGKAYTYYRMTPLIIIGLILLCVGAGIANQPDPYRGNTVIGKVTATNAPCRSYVKTIKQKSGTRRETWYDCDVKYTYNVNGKSYNHDKNFNKKQRTNVGSDINVSYNKSDPNAHQIDHVPYIYIGSGIGALGCCLSVSAIAMITMVSKVKGSGTVFMAGNLTSRMLNK